MKWYMALNEEGTMGDIALHTKIAVCSAKKCKNLEPHLLYTGPLNHFTSFLEENGVKIIQSELPYMKVIQDLVESGKYSLKTVGHWLRTNTCLQEDDGNVLYTDVDVFFNKRPRIENITPEFFAAAPEFKQDEWNYFNAGVMVQNLAALKHDYSDFEEYVVENIRAKTYQFHDQIAYNFFYRGRWDRLPLDLNWKPYWGLNKEASIIHFHGPKIGALEAIVDGKWNWESGHGRQIGSLFHENVESYIFHLKMILENVPGLQQTDLSRLEVLVAKLQNFDASKFDDKVDLAFTNHKMF